MPRQENPSKLAVNVTDDTDDAVPRRQLHWTNVDAPEVAARLHDGSGMALYEYMQVPTAHRPLPPNLLDADAPTPAETAKLTRGEIIALTAMSVIGIALIVSGLVWL